MENEKNTVPKEDYNKLLSEYKNLKIDLDNAILEINKLRRMIFCSKREKTPISEEIKGEQCSIFDNKEEMEKKLQEEEEKAIEEITVYRKKKSKKRVAGLKRNILKDVVVHRHEYVLNEEEKCPECENDLKLVGKKVIRTQIDFTPAILNITETVQNIYKCIKCGTEESEKETPTFVKSHVPNPLLAHSFASPTLAAEVFYQKYYLGVPFYRQEKQWDDKGLVLPRSMMANWAIKINEYYLEPLWELMLKKMKQNSELLQADETKLQVLKEPGRNAHTTSYMWVLRSGDFEKQKGVIFKYSPSRSGKTAEEFLSGFNGIIVTDGYAGYNNIESITHAECFAHCRRYFYDSVPRLSNKKMDTTATGYTRSRIL